MQYKNKNYKYIFIVAFLLSALFYFFSPYRYILPDYEFHPGQIAEKDFIAPFTFNIYKQDDVLKEEKEIASSKVNPVYYISDNINFSAFQNMDFLFQRLNEIYDTENDPLKIRDELAEDGFRLSEETIRYLSDKGRYSAVYETLSERMAKIFEAGIYPDDYELKVMAVNKGKEIKNYRLKQLYSLNEASVKIGSKINLPLQRKVIREIGRLILVENLIIDKRETEKLKRRAELNVNLFSGQVLQNEKIIEKGQEITEEVLQKLKSLKKEAKYRVVGKPDSQIAWSAIGVFVLNCILFFILLSVFPSSGEHRNFPGRFEIVIWGTLIIAIMSIVMNFYFKLKWQFIPLMTVPLLLSFLVNLPFSLIFNFVHVFIVSEFMGWNIKHTSLSAVMGFIVIVLIDKYRKEKSFWQQLGIVLAVSFVIVFAGYLFLFGSAEELLNQFAGIALSGLFTVSTVHLLLPFFEKRYKLVSREILKDMLDDEHPLLCSLKEKAQGTYHHSVMVGNLAYSGAQAINANALLAKVGGFYHDVGKINNADIFTENNKKSDEIHEALSPEESARLIRNHPISGVELAYEYKFPQAVTDIIREHHGTERIEYFWNKAKSEKRDVDPDDFIYRGPKPQSKESVLVMIADDIAATSSSLVQTKDFDPEKVFDNTIKKFIANGTFDESPVTFSDLKKIKEYMLPLLKGMFSKRVLYPEKKKK
ncbi:MAG: hypothetical protein CSB55_03430 [Candidatus Cloacimonadota bacterium]|nr:MAG: hypothetical protein CSB55_03430 [Candidatus Cloacimonadota bacterium]